MKLRNENKIHMDINPHCKISTNRFVQFPNIILTLIKFQNKGLIREIDCLLLTRETINLKRYKDINNICVARNKIFLLEFDEEKCSPFRTPFAESRIRNLIADFGQESTRWNSRVSFICFLE